MNTRPRFSGGDLRGGALDSAVASVVWKKERLDGILMVPRSDAFVSALEIPANIRNDLRSLDREAVARNAMALQLAVVWALPDIEFSSVKGFGASPLRDGASPAEFGAIRHFAPRIVGVDIGEFQLPIRRMFN